MKTMKKMITLLAVVGMVFALAPAAQAAPFSDNFDSDTSADYYNYRYDLFEVLGSSFGIDDSSNGKLQLYSDAGNALIHKTATLDIGETYKIDFLDATGTRGQIITKSATPDVGTSAHFYVARIRWNADNTFGGFNDGGDVTATEDIGLTSTLTSGGSSYIERYSTTVFNLYYDTGASTRVKYGDFTLAAPYAGDIFVGVQAHNIVAPFDNLLGTLIMVE